MSNENRLETLLKDDEGGGLRTKLNFDALEDLNRDLALRTKILRNRVVELENNFYSDSCWALRWFNRTAATAVFLPLVATIAWATFAVLKQDSDLSQWPIAVALTSIGALIAAGGQAFGWHIRYQAMIAARWKMTGLRTRIDQRLVAWIVDTDKLGELSGEDWNKLTSDVETWQATFEQILSEFGTEYGASLTPPQITK